LNLACHPEKNEEGHDPENNQRQAHRETDLHPLQNDRPASPALALVT